jgi:serpin B
MASTSGERAVPHLEFALALHRAVAPDPRGQVCWSPFSVASALGLLARGARGAGRDELVAVLGELDGLATMLAGAGRLAPAVDGEDEPVLAVSNTLWADASIDIEPSFDRELRGWSGGAVRNAPFQAEPEKARDVINADVAETTRQLIPELLPAGTIAVDTVSALVNALYLKCAWKHRFVEGATTPTPFHTPAGPVRVPAMALTERLGYAEHGGWRVIALAAAGGVEAVVLLPDGDLGDAEPRLDARSLAALLAAPRPRQVALRLPRLTITTKAELSDPLRALGVRTVFTDEADLSAISPRRLAVQAVLHESVLKIDEQGLEGAAATAVMMRLLAMPERPVPVTVDRPFLLVIRHAATGAVYFLARVTDPS